ncbi:30S ribosomal protein S6 [Leucoagaricus sp. SymC.cos]|nr:30S ribosomal protein S6 [Leucoagaricus sp. SymC.cos]
MPLYQMICIAAHFPEYQHIRSLAQKSATHIMNSGGVVRKIESWGTMQLPQRMKKKRSTAAYEYVGDYWSLHCDASPQTLRSLNNFLRRDPRVLRWSVLKLGDRVEDVAKQGRKLLQKTPSAADITDL